MSDARRILSVIGLGYVGLPLAVAFARAGFRVIGFDIAAARIAELRAGHDRTREVTAEALGAVRIEFTADEQDIRAADFHIVTVPTPIDAYNKPDLRALLAASHSVGRALKRGDVVVYESTVYPGATEEDCQPILERESGLKAGADFGLGYSPERINPGDPVHRFETIRKVVAASTPEALKSVLEVYGAVVQAGVVAAPNIRTAEAAKVLENTQRDLNIALMNELALICHRLGLDTLDVLAAAGTKWNFVPFTPGLVGGHCIGVDPYYLTHRAEKAGHKADVILAGRAINNRMSAFVAEAALQALPAHNRCVAVLGACFKENVPDLRNSKVKDLIRALQGGGASVQLHEPLADAQECADEMGLAPSSLPEMAGRAGTVILAVPHAEYRAGGWALVQKLLHGGRGTVLDVRGALDRDSKPHDIRLWRL